MSATISANQIRNELERGIAIDRRRAAPDAVPPDERVADQPRQLYRAPAFLPLTASAPECRVLDDLLGELWDLNQEHAGELSREVEAQYLLTGAARRLSTDFRRWAQDYFHHRSDRARLTPQDDNHLYLFFRRLLRELYRVLDDLQVRPASLNYFVLAEAVHAAVHLLYERTWRAYLDPVAAEPRRGAFWLEWREDVSCTPAMGAEMAAFCEHFHLVGDGLTEFLARCVSDAAPWADACRAWGREQVLGRLRDRMADVQEMRPFLMPRWRPERRLLRTADGRVLAWLWRLRWGPAALVAADDERQVYEDCARLRYRYHAVLDQDGLLLDAARPWRSVLDLPPVGGLEPLWINLALVERWHAQLLHHYVQIDWERLRPRSEEFAAGAATEDPSTPGKTPGPDAPAGEDLPISMDVEPELLAVVEHCQRVALLDGDDE